MPQYIYRSAHELAKLICEGRSLGPLHGVPVSIKEQSWIRGERRP